MTIGYDAGIPPEKIFKSVPQMPLCVTRMRTSSAPGCGMSASVVTRSPGPRSTRALTDHIISASPISDGATTVHGPIAHWSRTESPTANRQSQIARLSGILAGMPKLGVVIASVREGRVGLPVAQWFIERARLHAKFEIQTVDLKTVDLPVFAERHHSRLQNYENEKQKAWITLVAGLDSFVCV